MKTVQKLYSNLTRLTLAVLLTALTSCELPRESWNVIRRDGLLTYWSRDYNPTIAPTRFTSSNSSPFVPSQATPRVPYRPSSRSRYLADKPEVPYRPKAKTRRTQVTESSSSELADKREPKIELDPGKTVPTSTSTDTIKPSMDTLPYGTPVSGRPGMVTSPFAQKQQLVDVTGMAPGEAVKDPYSGKLFRVPPTQQAAAEKTEPTASAPEAEPQPKP